MHQLVHYVLFFPMETAAELTWAAFGNLLRQAVVRIFKLPMSPQKLYPLWPASHPMTGLVSLNAERCGDSHHNNSIV